MVLNYIWVGFFATAFLIALVQLCMGNTDVFPAIMDSTFENARNAFDISIGLTGVLCLWMGIMKIGERGGLVALFARLLSPVLSKIFPDIPKNHPVMGTMFMNISANLLGLDNAATPMGLKAMEQLQEINPKKDTASNPMIMFLVLNTSGLTIIPVSVLTFRAQLGAAQPTDVFVPILLATFFSTLVGLIVTCIVQHINLFNKTLMLFLGTLCLLVAGVIWGFSQMDADTMNTASTLFATILLFTIIAIVFNIPRLTTKAADLQA